MDNSQAQAQVVLVKDINPGNYSDGYPKSSYPDDLTEFNGKLYFGADDGINGGELWKTDGTASGTQLAVDINLANRDSSNPRYFTEFKDKLYFSANDGTNGRKLWKTDGTASGTQLVVDINSANKNIFDPGYFTESNGKLYFRASDEINGGELWKTDGTASGTQLVADINPGSYNGSPRNSNPSYLTEFKDKLYFRANDGINGDELWISDGTAAGTQLVADINPDNDNFGYPESSSPSYLTEFNGKLYFGANDGINGGELWVSDGTAVGTQLVANINPDNFDDYPAGSFPSDLTEFNGKLYFGANDGINGDELWVTDGTAAGTQLVADINPGNSGYNSASSSPRNLTEFNDKLYFIANDGINGDELWKTDGTAEGTQLVVDFIPGSDSDDSSPSDLTVLGDELFFSVDNGETGTELYKLTFDGVVDPVDPSEPNEINGTGNNDVLTGTDGIDIIKGFDGQDTLKGGAGDDTLIGNNRSDRLVGGAGNDSLIGGSGEDTLDGGLGNDTLIGNGNDSFVLRSGDGEDLITDYVIGSDRLLLADGLGVDDLTFEGNSILIGDETIATLNNVNTSNLRPFNFVEI